MSESPLAELSLFPATPEQIRKSKENTAVQWKTNLTVEEYLRRDEIMDGQEHSKDGQLVTWVLAPRSDPRTLEFMCSCETFRRKVAIAIPGAGSPRIQEVIGYGVASVFTPAPNRKKGYARHMMCLLHSILAPPSFFLEDFPTAWGAPPTPVDGFANAHLSVLYSDVGPVFYHDCGPYKQTCTGWATTGTTETIWDTATTPTASADDANTWKWLKEDEVETLWNRDAKKIRDDILEASSVDSIPFSFLPDRGVGAFSIQKTMHFREGKPVLPTDIWGVLRNEAPSASDALTFATWTLDIRVPPRALVVTRLRTTKERFPELLAKILEAAHTNRVEKVEIWALNEKLVPIAERLGGKTTPRKGHLSALKWYGKEDEKPVWLFNERFCWC